MFDYGTHDYDYEVDENESFSINKSLKEKMRKKTRLGSVMKVRPQLATLGRPLGSAPTAGTLRFAESALRMQRVQPLRSMGSLMGKMGGAGIKFAGKLALGPIGTLATAMSVGQYFVDSSFNRTGLQQDIKGLTDMFVESGPTMLSMAAFGAVESKISGKFGGGGAGGFLSKRLGGGGGLKGKAVSMMAGTAAYLVSSSILQPIKEDLSNAVNSGRSTGLMSSIVKGNAGQTEAAIRKMAEERGIYTGRTGIGRIVDALTPGMFKSAGVGDDKFALKEFAKTLKAPEGVGKMNTKQIQIAQRELQSTQKKIEGGFWNAAFNSNVMQWTGEMENDKALSTIRQELRDRNVNFQQTIKDNSDAIIDFYSRE